jgi:hypothetical protein
MAFSKASVARMQRDATTQKWSFAQMRSNIGDAVPVIRARKIGRAP